MLWQYCNSHKFTFKSLFFTFSCVSTAVNLVTSFPTVQRWRKMLNMELVYASSVDLQNMQCTNVILNLNLVSYLTHAGLLELCSFFTKDCMSAGPGQKEMNMPFLLFMLGFFYECVLHIYIFVASLWYFVNCVVWF